jgi:hypothetical protein
LAHGSERSCPSVAGWGASVLLWSHAYQRLAAKLKIWPRSVCLMWLTLAAKELGKCARVDREASHPKAWARLMAGCWTNSRSFCRMSPKLSVLPWLGQQNCRHKRASICPCWPASEPMQRQGLAGQKPVLAPKSLSYTTSSPGCSNNRVSNAKFWPWGARAHMHTRCHQTAD